MSSDWPHDPDGEEGSEGMRKYDMAVIAKKVDEDEDFPLDRDEFVAEYGDDPIRVNYRTVVPLSEIFEFVEQAEFETITDMHKAVGAAMRQGGFWDYHPQGVNPEQKHA
ncbi:MULTISPECIES: DUF5785 family protein [Natrialba]|uniref:Uncharacterized protein n=1 Tax=Natrialba aegyptia DSM 13077 TaxID=1227491 RepID=M0BID9_9EURY|nr:MULTISPECIES: DUF5785 family protein [Natrialba]ELZ10048.1 hypothetical protein C480_01917 [Natrialba aegyptia DSM 13077]